MEPVSNSGSECRPRSLKVGLRSDSSGRNGLGHLGRISCVGRCQSSAPRGGGSKRRALGRNRALEVTFHAGQFGEKSHPDKNQLMTNDVDVRLR